MSRVYAVQLAINVFFHKNNTLAKYQQGDVIVARPNGFQWGTRELSNPAWRIIQDDSITPLVLSIMCESAKTPELGFIKRSSHLDLTSSMIGYDFRRYLMDNRRNYPIYLAPFPLRLILASKLTFEQRMAA